MIGMLVPAGAAAAPGQGTVDDPVVVDALPYFVRGDTTDAVSDVIDDYACDPGTDESGAEWIYRFDLPADARVTAWVAGDSGTVDNDVHLLDDLTLDGAQATACAARGHTIAEADMTAGTHYVVVDTYNGEAQAGPFVLRMFAIGADWMEIPVGEGVVWRARRFADEDGDQVLNVLDLDMAVPGVGLEVYDPDQCMTVSAAASAHTPAPVAAVNSSFFSFDGVCSSVSLMKHAGMLLVPGVGAAAFGLTENGMPLVGTPPAGQDWPEAWEGQGGRGMLVEGGVPNEGAAWSQQGLSADFAGAHPRTIAGYRDDGTVVLGTVDGRHANASGKSLDALAAYAADELGCEGAVNWDGGGSTSMWVADMTPNGVVNYPSDGGEEAADHSGSRAVGGIVFVHADDYNWAPRFQSEPVLDGAVGEPYTYDADAIDLDVDDVVEYSLVAAPPGMTIDASTGAVSMMPTADSPAVADVTILASDGHGGDTEQTWTLQIEGGMVGGDGSTGDGGGDAGETGSTTGLDDGGSGSGSADAGADGGDEGGGCGCRFRPTPSSAWAWMMVAALFCRRRRQNRAPDA